MLCLFFFVFVFFWGGGCLGFLFDCLFVGIYFLVLPCLESMLFFGVPFLDL